MPKLQLLYSKKEDVPEDYASLYEEIDGKWKLTGIEGVKTQADIDAVLTAKQHEVDNRKTAETELAALKKKYEGIDADKAREILQEAENNRLKKNDPNVDLDKVKLQKDYDELQTKFNESLDQINQLKTEKKSATIKDALLKSARELNFDPRFDDDVELRASFFDISESGNVITKDGKTVSEFLSPLAEKYSLPSSGSGERGHTSIITGTLDKSKAYDKAKQSGDKIGMIANSPEMGQTVLKEK